ncbi:hypothetical protein [Microbacterium allomyrinae]|uniref:Uncharacterized protein n=1 Tax=Microbacterium allomyrinae TaxID=2830666 RepID=A0A9X1S215_9MICO|nr:hypothetical protein [Microbacterium allomyrinae]MCC2032201.1 hypothetical protein [Microbacterium allomyrinae]
MVSSWRELILEGIQQCHTATAIAVQLKTHRDPAVAELAKAVHFLSFGIQQIGLALSDEGRIDDLPIRRA